MTLRRRRCARTGNTGAGRERGARRGAFQALKDSAIAIVAIAVLAFAPLTALLGLDGQRRDRSRLQALDTDLLAGLQAVAVGTILDALQRLFDLADELALAIARAQLQAELLFLGGTIVGIGKICSLILHM